MKIVPYFCLVTEANGEVTASRTPSFVASDRWRGSKGYKEWSGVQGVVKGTEGGEGYREW